ncbi:protein-L-isoaspartate O-methyltransferase [Candidatus Geothermarchaeota archaeon]|nr:MAG: protein-L-isoaspartate O-methyltransferase [Candidatus Geothermarchaeota archaeon]
MKTEEELERLREKLVKNLIKEGILRSNRCIKAMLSVKRHLFVPEALRDYAYVDTPLPLGRTGQTISAPHMCAYMLEALELKIGDLVLEVGSGSGYQAALIAECVAPSDAPKESWGHVVTIELLDELYKMAKENLEENGYAGRVTCILGDGTLGFPPLEEGEIYDKILVTAGAPEVPEPLLKQIKKGGLIVIPVGGRFFQQLVKIRRLNDKYTQEVLTSCLFVPLRGRFGWKD